MSNVAPYYYAVQARKNTCGSCSLMNQYFIFEVLNHATQFSPGGCQPIMPIMWHGKMAYVVTAINKLCSHKSAINLLYKCL